MNKEQQEFWDIISHDYPVKNARVCRTCHYYPMPMLIPNANGGYLCAYCDSSYSKWKWDPSMSAKVDQWLNSIKNSKFRDS